LVIRQSAFFAAGQFLHPDVVATHECNATELGVAPDISSSPEVR